MERPADLTVDTYREALRDAECPQCGRKGHYETFKHPNNGGVGLLCACGKQRPLRAAGIMWLPQGTHKARPKAPETLEDTWARGGHYCWICGTVADDLELLQVGRTQHHTKPYARHGHAGTLIPVCTVCHEHVNACQRAMQRMTKVFASTEVA